MTDDWASQFRPDNELEESNNPHIEPEDSQGPLPDEEEFPDQPTIADVNEILISLKNIQSNLSQENIVLTERVSRLEQLILNPPWLNDLNSNLQKVLRDNAAALVGANNQFMAVLARKMDEMEERLSSDTPAYTNILYSNPELFNEISQREDEPEEEIATDVDNGIEAKLNNLVHSGTVAKENELSMEEEFVAQNQIAKMVDEEHPGLLLDGDDKVAIAYQKWQLKEIKWHEFVKTAGGVKAASDYKKQMQKHNS